MQLRRVRLVVKDQVIVTVATGPKRTIIHTYGPYTKNQARKLSKQWEQQGREDYPEWRLVCLVRKLIDLEGMNNG